MKERLAKADALVPIVLLGGLLLTSAVPATAASADQHFRFGPVLFGLAVLVAVAKGGGLLAERWGQPSVLGELLVGVIVSNLLPPFIGAEQIAFVRSDLTLRVLAEVGVLILLFDVGLEADLRALVRVGSASLLVAMIGVAVPMGLGWGAAMWLLPDRSSLVSLFIGATLSATSVGITARVLKDLDVTQTREGQIILGAAILDDVLGLMVLAVVSGLVTAAAAGGAEVSGLAIAGIFLRAVLFLGVTVALGHFFSNPLVRLVARTGHPEVMLVVGLGLCFTLAFVAERVGLADIIGAFAAGLLLDPYGTGVRTREEDATLAELLHPLASLFVPLFFVLMGLQVQLGSLASPTVFGFGGLLIVCALVGKLACALGVLGHGINRLAVAIGMIPRGEVGLIFAGIGTRLTLEGQPLLSPSLFSAVVLMVLVTTLAAPIGLRWVLKRPAVAAG
jgi:Kef-type K+ transport system membrane component KefB